MAVTEHVTYAVMFALQSTLCGGLAGSMTVFEGDAALAELDVLLELLKDGHSVLMLSCFLIYQVD